MSEMPVYSPLVFACGVKKPLPGRIGEQTK